MPSRSSIPGLYFTQGVWPCSLTHLGSAYVTACAVAEDLEVRDQPWWKNRPMQRYLELMAQRAEAEGIASPPQAGAQRAAGERSRSASA